MVESIGFSMCTIMSLYQWQFVSLIPIWMPFTSFSPWIAMSRVSNTMLNMSGESKHLCLVPDLRGKALSFCPLSMVFLVDLLYMAFIVLRNAPSIPTSLSVFIINGYGTLRNAFSQSIAVIMWFLFLHLFIWCIMFIDLWIWCHPCIPGLNPT